MKPGSEHSSVLHEIAGLVVAEVRHPHEVIPSQARVIPALIVCRKPDIPANHESLAACCTLVGYFMVPPGTKEANRSLWGFLGSAGKKITDAEKPTAGSAGTRCGRRRQWGPVNRKGTDSTGGAGPDVTKMARKRVQGDFGTGNARQHIPLEAWCLA